MKMTFRWFGKNDPVTLEKIRQIPMMSGIVSAVYDVPVGEVWPDQYIEDIKKEAMQQGLRFEVVESVPVHEEIKLGSGRRDELIANYMTTIRRLSKFGVKVICYNFMPVFDWVRSELAKKRSDGSYSLAYDHETIIKMDPSKQELSLPGWDESYSKEELQMLLKSYQSINEDKLWENFAYFLKKVIPVCEEYDIKLAIHPDDPPWGLFGLPRIITGAESYARMQGISPSKANGITLCFGSLGANPKNNLVEIASTYADYIHFVHARNVQITGNQSFEEAPHPSLCGSLNLYEVLKALHDAGFSGYIRPDHGRMIWGETGRPGYGLFDRALGATYLTGLWEAIEKEGRINEITI